MSDLDTVASCADTLTCTQFLNAMNSSWHIPFCTSMYRAPIQRPYAKLCSAQPLLEATSFFSGVCDSVADVAPVESDRVRALADS